MTTAPFRVSNSLEHLRTEVKGNIDGYRSNPDLLVLRKLIAEEESMHHDSFLEPSVSSGHGLGSGFFQAPAPGHFSVDRISAPGQWAAEARRHNNHPSVSRSDQASEQACAFIQVKNDD